MNGRTIEQVAADLQTIRATAQDFKVATSSIAATGHPDDGSEAGLRIAFDGRQFEPTEWCHGQVAQTVGVPAAYYKKLLTENAVLLSGCINHGLMMASQAALRARHVDDQRLVRVVGGKCRALLSSRYRRLDNFDLLEAVFPEVIGQGLKIKEAELTEQRLYIKAVSDQLTADIKVGDPVRYGLIISGSDVGSGAVRVEPYIDRLVCSNGLIRPAAMRKMHLGRDDFAMELLSEKTLSMGDAAFWAGVRDIVRGSLRPEMFQRDVELLRAAAGDVIANYNIPEVVEVTAKVLGIDGAQVKEKESIVAYLARGADGAGYNRYGLAQAVSFAAHNAKGYDDAVWFERAASEVLTIGAKDWAKISKVAA